MESKGESGVENVVWIFGLGDWGGRWWHDSMKLELWEGPRFQGVTPSVEFSLGHVQLAEAVGSPGGELHLTLNPSSFLSAWLPHPPDTDQTLEWWGEGALRDL